MQQLRDDHPSIQHIIHQQENVYIMDMKKQIGQGDMIHHASYMTRHKHMMHDKKKQGITMSTHKPNDERYKTEEQKKQERREAQAELDRKRKAKKEKQEKRQKELEEKQKQREEAAKIERERKKAEKLERARKQAEEEEAKEATEPTPPPQVIVASHEKKAPFKKQKDTAKETSKETSTETPTHTSTDSSTETPQQHTDKEEL